MAHSYSIVNFYVQLARRCNVKRLTEMQNRLPMLKTFILDYELCLCLQVHVTE